MNTIVIALRATIVTLVLTGLAYPLAVTGLAQVLFPSRANGSIITDDKGHEVGSELIGQSFVDPAYVRSRPSANAYDASNSGGTNLATTSAKLRDGTHQLADAYRADNQLAAGVEVPADAVSSSASGLDPDVSPDNALLQAGRIAAARGVAVDRVTAVIAEYVEPRELGVLGEEHVNVLLVNLALDRMFGATMTRK